MFPSFNSLGRTKFTSVHISDIPMPSPQHIMSIDPITDQNSDKNLDTEENSALPNPGMNLTRRHIFEGELVI